MARWCATFPSPCGVRRVRDFYIYLKIYQFSVDMVSVPLRGKEGAGLPLRTIATVLIAIVVSVPLRGKEGAGRTMRLNVALFMAIQFPSPCGVRRVRDASPRMGSFYALTPVSVPLRGKEGAGPLEQQLKQTFPWLSFRPLAG